LGNPEPRDRIRVVRARRRCGKVERTRIASARRVLRFCRVFCGYATAAAKSSRSSSAP
jgi:hypothetical protein